VIYQGTLTRCVHSVCDSLYFHAVSITSSIGLPMPERASTVQAIEHRKSKNPTLGKCHHTRHCSYTNKTSVIVSWKTFKYHQKDSQFARSSTRNKTRGIAEKRKVNVPVLIAFAISLWTMLMWALKSGRLLTIEGSKPPSRFEWWFHLSQLPEKWDRNGSIYCRTRAKPYPKSGKRD